MHPRTPRGIGRTFALVAVVQAILLICSVAVGMPAAVFAQEEDPAAAEESAPDGGRAEPEPEAQAEPEPVAEPDPEPEPDPDPKPEPETNDGGRDSTAGGTGDKPKPDANEPNDAQANDGRAGGKSGGKSGDEPARVQAVAEPADNEDNSNNPEYWEDLGYGECFYWEPFDQTSHGTWTDGGTTFTMGNPPAGLYFSLLIIRAGSDDSSPDSELVFENPIPGQTYGPVIGDNGQPKQISHIIVCKLPAGKLKVKKIVVGGPLESDDFSISVKQGGSNIPGSPQPGDASPGNVYPNLIPGDYQVSEDPEDGYTGVISGDCDDHGNVEVTSSTQEDPYQVCIITNTYEEPPSTLKIVKIVINDDGGEAQMDDFQGYVDGNPQDWEVAVKVDPGTYALSEDGLLEYAASEFDCGDAPQDGEDVTVVVGEDVVCAITNDDIAPTLKLVKVVSGEDPPDAPDAWTLSAGAADPWHERNFSNLGGQGAFETVYANAGYLLAEVGPTGYEASGWSCDGGELVDSTVTLDLADEVTCTITNRALPSSLTLVKVVSNGNGGTATEADFTPFIDATEVAWGDSNGLPPGDYVASETLDVPGYAAGEWSGDCDAEGNISLALGEHKTCTITNDDIAPELTLIKVKEGGPDDEEDWTLTGNGPTPISGTTPVESGDGFSAGTYTLSEDGPSGYVPSDWVCVGGTQDGASITLELGETAECTITNRYPGLTITKSASPQYFSAVGDEIEYTITATNTGLVPVDDVTITDPLLDAIPLVCVPANGSDLGVGESIECKATYPISEGDFASGTVPNTACATSDETDEICAGEVVERVTIEVVKTASVSEIQSPGGSVDFTFTVTNTSAVPLEITDLKDTDFTLSGDDDCQVGTVLAPFDPNTDDDSCEFTESHEVDDNADPLTDHVNTFTACGEADTEEGAEYGEVCATDPETISFFGGSGSGGGGGGGGGGNLPPTDSSLTKVTQQVAAAPGQAPMIVWPILAIAAGLMFMLLGWTFRRENVRGGPARRR